MKRFIFIAGAALLALTCTSPGAAQTQTQPYPAPQTQATRSVIFQTHAAFFSKETGAQPPLDPQAFVVDDAAKAGTGPQGVEHIAGVRPMRLAEPDAPLINGEGSPLLFTVSKWLAGTGNATITDVAGGGDEVTLRFQKLIAFGVYSVFKNTFSQAGVSFAPLDGDGTKNSFTADADGSATLVVSSPQRLTNRNAILLVYHSDGQEHGAQRGKIGYDAHHHLIAPIP